jgi:hypothetical protein
MFDILDSAIPAYPAYRQAGGRQAHSEIRNWYGQLFLWMTPFLPIFP